MHAVIPPTPLGVGLETPSLGVGLETHPLGVGLNPPQVWFWRDPPRPDPSTSPWVWAWRPPQVKPFNSPPGCGPGDPPGQTPQLPPWVWAWRPARHAAIPPPRDLQGILGYHLQCMLGYHSPTCEQNDWQTRLKT